MSETPSRGDGPNPAPPADDPWAAFGYLVAGVLFYGLVGWGLSLWLHASYWLPIGILVGAALGIFMVFQRYRFQGGDGEIDDVTDDVKPDSPSRPMGRATRRGRDDQGET
jgi:ATP synthase protein I